MSLPAEKPEVPRTGPLVAPRRSGSLNLARRPFTNTRPVTRVSILLWVLGLLLLLGNVSLFWSYLSGSAEKREELERLVQDVQRQQQTLTQLDQRLASLDLEEQNRQVRFLNRKIAERTFSWSLLFDRLAAVLPDDVRLSRLAPQRSRRGTGAEEDKTEPEDGRVPLVIQGESRSDEGLLNFVDRLFAHDSFENPDFPRETSDEERDLVRFDVRVIYFPGEAPPQGVEIEEEGPAPEAPGAPTAPAAPTPGTGPDAGSETGA